jgi:hypothetical protein
MALPPPQVSTDVFQPEILAELIVTGFANIPILYGSGVVKLNPSMMYGSAEQGNIVLVPYTDDPVEWQEVLEAADAPQIKISIGGKDGKGPPEQAKVRRWAILSDFTRWAKKNPMNPYGILRQRALVGFGQTMDTALIATAADITIAPWIPGPPIDPVTMVVSPGVYTIDVSLIGNGKLDHSSVVLAKSVLKAEGWNNDFVFGAISSYTIGTMSMRSLTTGLPGYLVVNTGEMTPSGGRVYRMEPLGIPLLVNDKVDAGAPSGLHISSFMCADSLALWLNPELSTGTVYDPQKDADIEGMNAYAALHRYFKRMGKASPGIVNIIHK